MRVSITDNVANDPRWFPILDLVCLIVEDGRHVFSAADIPHLLTSAWVSARPEDTRDLIRLSALSASHDSLANQNVVEIDQLAPRGGNRQGSMMTSVNPVDAIAFLTLPFQVIVENETFDGAFLLWMAKALGHAQLINAYRQGHFVFRHAGGKDAIQRSAVAFSKGVWPRQGARNHRALREWMCVVLDNDQKHPGHAPNANILANVLGEVAFVHELKRRSIESYLPQSHLERLLPHSARKKIGALFRLTATQRFHYHMKDGFHFKKGVVPTFQAFNAAPSREVPAASKTLYATVPQADWVSLMDGFGSKLAKAFYEISGRPNSNDAAVLSDGGKPELSALLDRIYGYL